MRLCACAAHAAPRALGVALRAASSVAAHTSSDAATPDPQSWHVRGGAGGTKLRNSTTAGREGLDRLSLDECLALKRSVSSVLGEGHPASVRLHGAVERAAVFKREWTDEEFQDGEAGNADRVNTLEARFRAAFKEGTAGLADPVTLGMALDLVGVYLKNYKVAKASAIMEEALPICRRKGGVWLIKALNHASTVRMKQQRHAEALVMLRELESLIHFEPSEAAELYDMLYRNIGMALQALGKSQEALPYYLQCAKVKGVATWWDRWDVGYCMATVAFELSDSALLRRAAATIASAIPQHREAEPGEHVMHAKIRQALGDCYLALATLDSEGGGAGAGGGGASPVEAALSEASSLVPVEQGDALEVHAKEEYLELSEAEYREAHSLFTSSCGESNDLSGWCAAAVALVQVQRGKHSEALAFLLHAIFVAATSDIPKLAQLATNIDLVAQCHNQVQDAARLAPFLPHFATILTRLDSPLLNDPEKVCPRIRRSVAVLYASSDDPAFRDTGVELLAKLL